MVFIYAIYSKTADIVYVGITKNLDQRIREHNTKKSTFTKAYTPWDLIYFETCDDYPSARKREKYLKSAAGKKFIYKKLNQ